MEEAEKQVSEDIYNQPVISKATFVYLTYDREYASERLYWQF